MQRPIRIVTLSTLFPSHVRPQFGIFVGRQTRALTQRDGIDLYAVNPIGLPIWPLNWLGRFRALAKSRAVDDWNLVRVLRPRFRTIPRFGQTRNPKAIAKAVLPKLRKLHAAKPFDIIAAEFFYPDGPAAQIIADDLGIPFTIKARGADIHYWGAQEGCREQMLAAAKASAGMLAVSSALRDDMIALGMDGAKIKVHYTGIDRRTFEPVDRKIVKEELGLSGTVITSVGAVIARKRQDLVIRALPDLPGTTLLLIGQGEEEAAYRALAKQLGVADRVTFLGSIDHHSLARYVAASDIMALVSASEGLANAWVEALAAGTPVIACDVGGARELIKDDSAGRIVEPDPNAIVAAVQSILADYPRPYDVRANVAAFSWEENAEQLDRFYRSILQLAYYPQSGQRRL